jgi:hypothetical protein
MAHYLDFDLFRLGPSADQRDRLTGAGRTGLFVAFQTTPQDLTTEQPYLEKILDASGFPNPAESCLLLPVYAEEAIDLSELRLPATVRQFAFLGIPPQRCGFTLRAQPYRPVSLNNRLFLFGDSVATIHAERQAGGKAKSGALWRALQEMSERG